MTKSNSFSRRGILMGAAAIAATRLKAAGETVQQLAVTEDVPGAVGAAPPFAYVGCYTGGSNARGISEEVPGIRVMNPARAARPPSA